EEISGLSLEDYFRHHIFDPLKMADTFYYVPQDKLDRLVTVNRRQANGSMVVNSMALASYRPARSTPWAKIISAPLGFRRSRLPCRIVATTSPSLPTVATN